MDRQPSDPRSFYCVTCKKTLSGHRVRHEAHGVHQRNLYAANLSVTRHIELNAEEPASDHETSADASVELEDGDGGLDGASFRFIHDSGVDDKKSGVSEPDSEGGMDYRGDGHSLHDNEELADQPNLDESGEAKVPAVDNLISVSDWFPFESREAFQFNLWNQSGARVPAAKLNCLLRMLHQPGFELQKLPRTYKKMRSQAKTVPRHTVHESKLTVSRRYVRKNATGDAAGARVSTSSEVRTDNSGFNSPNLFSVPQTSHAMFYRQADTYQSKTSSRGFLPTLCSAAR